MAEKKESFQAVLHSQQRLNSDFEMQADEGPGFDDYGGPSIPGDHNNGWTSRYAAYY